jgi:hypothetical protein
MKKRVHRIVSDLAFLGIISVLLLGSAFLFVGMNYSIQEKKQHQFVLRVGNTGSIIVMLQKMSAILGEYRHEWAEENYRQYIDESRLLDDTVISYLSDASIDESAANQMRRLSWFNEYQRQLLEEKANTYDSVQLFATTSYLQLALGEHRTQMEQLFQKELSVNSADYFSQESSNLRQSRIIIEVLCLVLLGIILLFVRLVMAIDGSISETLKNLEHLAQHDWNVGDLDGGKFVEFVRLYDAVNYVKKELHEFFLKQQFQSVREKELVNAQIHALRAQVNPHFLFNALHQIGMASLVEPPQKVMQLVESTGMILRYSLDMQRDFVGLSEELEIVQKYIFLQVECHERSILYSVKVQDGMPADVEILPMSIQPLVENCIKHGFDEHVSKPFQIKIEALSTEKMITVSVWDNGVGFSENDNLKPDSKDGIGLVNIKERLQMVYNKNDLLTVESRVGEYTKVTISFPQKDMNESFDC